MHYLKFIFFCYFCHLNIIIYYFYSDKMYKLWKEKLSKKSISHGVR